MSPDHALAAMRALLDDTRAAGDTVSVPRRVAEALTATLTDVRTADLLVALVALDLADCSPRMMQRRVELASRLRLDPADDNARAQAADLLAAARLRRRLHEAMATALDDGDTTRAQRLRQRLLDADAEALGWQDDAQRALAAAGNPRR